jgi:hypothetical protein
LTGNGGDHCLLESNHRQEGGYLSLVFQGISGYGPLRCDGAMFNVCPFKVSGQEGAPLDSRGTVHCPWCGNRHAPGSLNRRLCQEWHVFKDAYHEINKDLPGDRKFFLHGSRAQVFSADCDERLRRMLWPKVHITILRRDRFTCQDCGRQGRQVVAGKLRGLEVHHIIPRSEGGTDHPTNLKTVCIECHKSYTAESARDRAIIKSTERQVNLLSFQTYKIEQEQSEDEDNNLIDLDMRDE